MKRAVLVVVLLLAGCAPQPYAYPDIAAALDSRQRAIIDQMYSGRITEIEAKARMDEARMMAVSEEQRRNAANRPAPFRGVMICTQNEFGSSMCY